MVDLPMPGMRRPGGEPAFSPSSVAPGSGVPPVVTDPNAPWRVAVGRDEAGLPVHVRWDPVALAVAPVPGFDLQLGVTVPLSVAGDDGLPSPAEEHRLAVIEDDLRAGLEVGERARLVLVVTTRGVREFVAYAEADEWVAGWVDGVRERLPGAQVMTQLDASWNSLHYFTP